MNNTILQGVDLITLIKACLISLGTLTFSVAFKVWLTKKWRERVRVRVVHKMREKKFQKLSALYCERVPDCERVPPKHFRAFFSRRYSVTSVRDFRRRVQANNGPVHLLLVAEKTHEICGFLKAIFVPDCRCLFIAYLVSVRPNNEADNVADLLLSRMLAACRNSGIHSIACEICVQGELAPDAKARLFRHYAGTHGLQLRRIEAKYQQPEICSFESGDCNLTDAHLYLAYLDNPAQDAWAIMDREQYQALVSAIYKNVYLLSYALAEPQLLDRYATFLKGVTKTLFATMRSKTIALK